MNAVRKDITRQQLEDKFRELRGEVDNTTASAKSYALAAGAVAVVAVVGVAYLLGRRRGKKRSTVVEIKRL
jgi:hypothetical protein